MLQTGFIFSCSILLSYIMSYFYQYMLLSVSFINWNFYSTHIVRLLISVISILLPALFFGRISGFDFKKSLTMKRDRSSAYILALATLLGIVLVPFVTQINNIFVYVLSPILKTGDVSLTGNPSSVSGLIFMLITSALYTAFAEELFFRGVLLSPIKGKLKPRSFILFAALLFALAHFSMRSIAATFIMGIVFIVTVKNTRSLLPAMVIHFVYNAAVLVVNYLSVDWILITDLSDAGGYLNFAIKMLSCVGLIAVITYTIRELLTKSRGAEPILHTERPAHPEDSPQDKQADSHFSTLDFISFLPGAFIILMSLMQELKFF